MKTKANTLIEDGQDISVNSIKTADLRVGEYSRIYETPSGTMISFAETINSISMTNSSEEGLLITQDGDITLNGGEIVLDVNGDTVVFDAEDGVVFNVGAKFNYGLLMETPLSLKRYTTELRPLGGIEGSIIYDSTLKKCILFNGTAWVNLDGTALS